MYSLKLFHPSPPPCAITVNDNAWVCLSSSDYCECNCDVMFVVFINCNIEVEIFLRYSKIVFKTY